MRRNWAPVVVALALGLAGCSRHTKPEAETTSQRIELPSGRITVSAADIVSPAQPLRPLDDVVRGQVLDSVRAVFTATMADPLVKGRAGDLTPLFTPDALAAAVGPDRPALFDEGLPLETALRVRSGDVRLRALENEAGSPALVVAAVDWDVAAPDGSLSVHRVGDLTLVPRDGRWLVDRYGLVVTRTVAGASSTTTATTATTP